MFKQNDPTQTTLTYAGREYLVRELPAEYQSDRDDNRSRRTYWASACGEILSTTKHGVVRKLKPQLTPNYQGELRKRYRLRDDSTTAALYGHVLVAAAWCAGKDTLDANGKVRDQVNHIDQDQLNNAASNLHYVSASENSRHAHVVMPAAQLEQRYNAGEESLELTYYDEIIAAWLADEDIAEYYPKPDCNIVEWLTDAPQPRTHS